MNQNKEINRYLCIDQKFIKMDLEARKYHIIEQVMFLTELEINKVEAVLNTTSIDPLVEKELIARALESEEDIKAGKVFTIEEAEARLNQQFGA